MMQIELSVNEDVAVPPAVKGLNEEVKAVKAWIEGSGLFGAPHALNEEVPPADATSKPIPPVGEGLSAYMHLAQCHDPFILQTHMRPPHTTSEHHPHPSPSITSPNAPH
jgi:hypothetical protein